MDVSVSVRSERLEYIQNEYYTEQLHSLLGTELCRTLPLNTKVMIELREDVGQPLHLDVIIRTLTCKIDTVQNVCYTPPIQRDAPFDLKVTRLKRLKQFIKGE